MDARVGSRLKQRREQLGLDMDDLADKVGVTAAQMAAYEAGARRVDAANLPDLATALSVPMAFFFEGL